MRAKNIEEFCGVAFSNELSDVGSHIGWGRPEIRQQDDRGLRKLRSQLLSDFGRSFDRVQTVVEQDEIYRRIREGIRAREPDQNRREFEPGSLNHHSVDFEMRGIVVEDENPLTGRHGRAFHEAVWVTKQYVQTGQRKTLDAGSSQRAVGLRQTLSAPGFHEKKCGSVRSSI